MDEEKTKIKKEKDKQDEVKVKNEVKKVEVSEKKVEKVESEKKTEVKDGDKKEEKKEQKKDEKKSKSKDKEETEKTTAVAKSFYAPISPKHSVNILNFIRNKDVDWAIGYLELVVKKKKAVPFPRFNRDNPHRKGDMEKGKYPSNASKHIIEILKSAKANAKNLGVGEENLIITKAISNRSFSKRSRRGRYTNIEIALSKKGGKND